MVRTERWKYVRFEKHPPLLFDRAADPQELTDQGRSPDFAGVRSDLDDLLFDWVRNRRLRVTLSDETVLARTGKAKERGFLFGVW